MNTHVRTRRNSRIVTENLLNFSEQTPNYASSTLLIDEQQPTSSTQIISGLHELKNNSFFRSTTLSFKTNSSVTKKSPQLKKQSFMDQFLKKKQISLTKVSLRYNRINMALSDMSEVYNQTCFMSKKLKTNENHSTSQRKSSLSQTKKLNVKQQVNNNRTLKRVYMIPQQQKVKKLQNINQVKKKYTFFGKCNKTII